MKALAAVLLLASVCAGQQQKHITGREVFCYVARGRVCTPKEVDAYDKGTQLVAGSPWPGTKVHPEIDPLPPSTAPKPLKCVKWERHTGDVCSKTQGLPVVCGDRCAPIMHEVSEKDWQELMERLKKLESERTPPLSDMHCATVEYRPSNNARFDDYVQGHGVDLYGCFATKSGAGKE